MTEYKSPMLFKYNKTDLIIKNGENAPKQVECVSQFTNILINLWESLMADGLFRYKLNRNTLPFKILPGEFNYVAQLNPDRATKRRKPAEIQSPHQPFNEEDFNFNKVAAKEILMRLLPEGEAQRGKGEHMLLINISPLEYCHVLLTPNRNLNGNQKLTSDGLQLAVDLVLLSNSRNFRVGFNSLCGFASVNHEHWHAYLLDNRLYIENAPLKRLTNELNCFEFENIKYPPGFCVIFEGGETGLFVNCLILKKFMQYFEENGVAHNIYITRGSSPRSYTGEGSSEQNWDSVRIFIWARTSSFGAKSCDAFNAALCELAGHFPIKNEKAYENLTEDSILKELHAICDEPFAKLKKSIMTNF